MVEVVILLAGLVVVVVGLGLLIGRAVTSAIPDLPKLHDTFCTCQECREKMIRKEVQRQEWQRMYRETSRAVEEMDRSAWGQP